MSFTDTRRFKLQLLHGHVINVCHAKCKVGRLVAKRQQSLGQPLELYVIFHIDNCYKLLKGSN